MDALYLITIGILLIVIAILAVKFVAFQKEVDKLIDSFGEIIGNETNSQIRVSSDNKYIRNIAVKLNSELIKLREEEIKYSRGNSELNTAIVNVSHDLRTPLTAIGGYMELLENEDMSSDARKYLSIVGERIEALKSLTEELFRYSVVTEDEFNPEEVCLNSELENSIAAFYGALVEKNIEPEINITEERVLRNLDRKSVQRIFSNIIGNAIKYSEGDLYVSLMPDGEIIFKNRASGISATDVGKLFNRFYTVESAHNSTGLGLSIAKLLTEKNGGSIEAELKSGELIIRLKFHLKIT